MQIAGISYPSDNTILISRLLLPVCVCVCVQLLFEAVLEWIRLKRIALHSQWVLNLTWNPDK
jgi:hypothetical protein